MVDPDRLDGAYGRKLNRMREVTASTGYETGLSVCSANGDGEHTKQPVLGTINETGGSRCEVGTDPDVEIHTHNHSPPSTPDLKRLVKDEADHCVMINGVRRDKEIVEDKSSSLMVCMEAPEDVKREEVTSVARGPEGDDDHIKEEDLRNLEEAGVKVKTKNLQLGR